MNSNRYKHGTILKIHHPCLKVILTICGQARCSPLLQYILFLKIFQKFIFAFCFFFGTTSKSIKNTFKFFFSSPISESLNWARFVTNRLDWARFVTSWLAWARFVTNWLDWALRSCFSTRKKNFFVFYRNFWI